MTKIKEKTLMGNISKFYLKKRITEFFWEIYYMSPIAVNGNTSYLNENHYRRPYTV